MFSTNISVYSATRHTEGGTGGVGGVDHHAGALGGTGGTGIVGYKPAGGGGIMPGPKP